MCISRYYNICNSIGVYYYVLKCTNQLLLGLILQQYLGSCLYLCRYIPICEGRGVLYRKDLPYNRIICSLPMHSGINQSIRGTCLKLACNCFSRNSSSTALICLIYLKLNALHIGYIHRYNVELSSKFTDVRKFFMLYLKNYLVFVNLLQ